MAGPTEGVRTKLTGIWPLLNALMQNSSLRIAYIIFHRSSRFVVLFLLYVFFKSILLSFPFVFGTHLDLRRYRERNRSVELNMRMNGMVRTTPFTFFGMSN